MSIGDLSNILNVDFNRVEDRSNDLARQNKFHVVMGQIITSDYLDRVAEEMNEKLQQDGIVNLGRITKTVDLPTEFLRKVILRVTGGVSYVEHSFGFEHLIQIYVDFTVWAPNFDNFGLTPAVFGKITFSAS